MQTAANSRGTKIIQEPPEPIDLNRFQLGAIVVEPSALRLLAGDTEIALEPKVMALLVIMSRRPCELWQRGDLIDAIWPNGFGSDESLSRLISILRKSLKRLHTGSDMLVTVPKFGYRLEAAVSRVGSDPTGTPNRIDPPIKDDKSIAVLAFKDLSDTGDQAYFADGIAEEIINALVRVPNLDVAGRVSSFTLREPGLEPRQIGDALGVAYLLQGSVRKMGARVRITTQLVRTRDGFHQWSETHNGALDDVFDLQDSIAVKVASELDMLLNAGADRPLAPRQTSSFEAYDLLLRARAAYRISQDDATINGAEALLRQAVRIDPDFAAAWVEIATLNNVAAGYNGKRTLQSAFNASKAAVTKAQRIAPGAPETIIWSANIRYFEGDALGAYRMAKSAMALAPQDPGIVFSVGHYAACFSYHEESHRLLTEALRLDPLDGFAWHMLARVCHNLGELDNAERHAEHAIGLGDALAHEALAWIAMAQGKPDLAEQRYMTFFERVGEQLDGGAKNRPLWEMMARACFRGSGADAGALRQGLAMQMADEDFQPRSQHINVAACLGMVHDTMALWDRSYAARSLIAVSMWSDLQWARDLRTHPAFAEFAEARGLAAIWREFGWPKGISPNPGTDGSAGQFRVI